MGDLRYTQADLELFVDLDAEAKSAGLAPYLIGAGAIHLGEDEQWRVRLDRTTLDWDFAIRVDSRREYELFLGRLLDGGNFKRAAEPHRLIHRSGGALDVIPYGSIAHPGGTVRWGDGVELTTNGLDAVEKHSKTLTLGDVNLRVAYVPVIVGLKLLAYASRRPGDTHDIGDVLGILRAAEQSFSDARVQSEALDVLESDEVKYGEVGAYLLGRDVGRAFPEDALSSIQAVLAEVDRAEARIVLDAVRAASSAGLEVDEVRARLQALRLGVAGD